MAGSGIQAPPLHPHLNGDCWVDGEEQSVGHLVRQLPHVDQQQLVAAVLPLKLGLNYFSIENA